MELYKKLDVGSLPYDWGDVCILPLKRKACTEHATLQ